MHEENTARSQFFIKDIFEKAELDKRETQRQNIITSFNMLGGQLANVFGNPKFMMKAAYMSVMIFGAFHVTKLSLAIMGSKILARMGKP